MDHHNLTAVIWWPERCLQTASWPPCTLTPTRPCTCAFSPRGTCARRGTYGLFPGASTCAWRIATFWANLAIRHAHVGVAQYEDQTDVGDHRQCERAHRDIHVQPGLQSWDALPQVLRLTPGDGDLRSTIVIHDQQETTLEIGANLANTPQIYQHGTARAEEV